MTRDISGQAVVITGASSGIGRTACKEGPQRSAGIIKRVTTVAALATVALLVGTRAALGRRSRAGGPSRAGR